MLKHKSSLKDNHEMKGVYINGDKPIEGRKAKSILCKAAYTARHAGFEVEFSHNRIQIKL